MIRFGELGHAEGLFCGYEGTCHWPGGKRCITARGGRALRSQCQHSGELGKVLRETGRCAAKLRGGSVSPLEEHGEFLLSLIDEQPDLTLTKWFL